MVVFDEIEEELFFEKGKLAVICLQSFISRQ